MEENNKDKEKKDEDSQKEINEKDEKEKNSSEKVGEQPNKDFELLSPDYPNYDVSFKIIVVGNSGKYNNFNI